MVEERQFFSDKDLTQKKPEIEAIGTGRFFIKGVRTHFITFINFREVLKIFEIIIFILPVPFNFGNYCFSTFTWHVANTMLNRAFYANAYGFRLVECKFCPLHIACSSDLADLFFCIFIKCDSLLAKSYFWCFFIAWGSNLAKF